MDTQLVRDTLQRGDLLSWYRIERVLGRGGFGITYLATDTNLDRPVAIKEYLPDEFAERNPDNSIRPSTPAYADTFSWGLDRFISEAKTLVKFKHPNIVQVYSVFEQNSTAYLVMEFEQGCELKEYLKRPDTNTEENLKTIFAPVIEGLQQVHQYGFIHRDIKPANIYIRDNGSPVLLDFGSARQTAGDSTRMLTSLVTVGYTPLEQYSEAQDNAQGPWTDIYAMGAVLYYAITGATPVDSTRRASAILNGSPDPLKPLRQTAANRYSQPFLSAIDWALAFAVADRPQNLEQWADALFSSPKRADSKEPGEPAPQHQQMADDSTVLIPATELPPKQPTAQTNQYVEDSISVPLNDPPMEEPWEFNTGDAAPANYVTAKNGKAKNAKKKTPYLSVAGGLVGIAILGTAGWWWLQNSSAISLVNDSSDTHARPAASAVSRAVDNDAEETESGSSPSTAAIVTPVTTPPLPQVAAIENPVSGDRLSENQGLQNQLSNSGSTEQLQKLVSAVTSANIDELRRISDLTSTTERLLSIVFQGQASIDASIITPDATSSQLPNDTAHIEIRAMTNHSGYTTAPAPSYRQLTVQLDTTGTGKPMVDLN